MARGKVTDKFPENFQWGVATAAYQIEGAVREDGRGPSIWDEFSHIPGRILHGENGDVACDHYHRMREDVALMAELGIRHYRFSTAWSRIYPMGQGALNPAGLDFYDRLVDTLAENGIEPLLTLYHWDLPLALQERGGWLNRDTAKYFRDYAATLFDALGDRVKQWVTHNEPWVTTVAGHMQGRHAPGIADMGKVRAVAHHLLLSHGLAVQAFRQAHAGRIGITLNLHPVQPASESERDTRAARLHDVYHNTWFLDPIFRGEYPAALDEFLPPAGACVQAGDLAVIREPMDFLGVNYYAAHTVQWDSQQVPSASVAIPQGAELTEMGWTVDPQGLTDLLARISRDYGPIPLLITENGAAYPDALEGEGGQVAVHDVGRERYLAAHIAAMGDALDQGINLQGYYVWSLLDNFEWALGYSKRFGIVYVDYPTQRRIVKDSGKAYSAIIREFEASRR